MPPAQIEVLKEQVHILYLSATNGFKPSIKVLELHTEKEIKAYLESLGWQFSNYKDSTYGMVLNPPTNQCPAMTDHLAELVNDVLKYTQNKKRAEPYQKLIEQKICPDPELFLDQEYGFIKLDNSVSCFDMIIKLEL